MKKKSVQSQSQRKKVSKILYERNLFKNKYSNMNTFRQTKDLKYFLSNEKKNKKIISDQESPRTIDYIQVMKKYEHLIEQNTENEKNEKNGNNYLETDYNLNNKNSSIKNLMNNSNYNNENNNDKKEMNNIIYLNYEKGKNKSYKNIRNFFNDKIGLDKNQLNKFFDKNEEYKKNNITGRITRKNISYNSLSFNNLNNTNINQNNIFKKYNNNNKSFSFVRDILNQENNKNDKSNIINYNNNNNDILLENMKQIISLCQKYSKIMNNSINFIEVNSINNSSDIFHELKNIIKQYNKFIFSEKIKNFIFQEDFNKNAFLLKNYNKMNNFTLKEFEPKNLNFTEKFRSKISALKNEKCKIYDELNNYKKKNKFLSLEKDEMDIIINKLKKENEELINKIKKLENIENKYYLQNNEINKLKGQIDNLNIDIKYKENIINNLQQILEQIKYNSNIINNNYQKSPKNNIINENNKQNNQSGFLSDINNESIEKDIITPCNLNVNSIIENILNLDEDDKIKKDIKYNNNEEEQKKISEKIEKIDQDILDLKTKLKKIYSK